MEAGDIIGPWIFEDLQKGFGALKWTRKQGGFLIKRFYPYPTIFAGGGTCEENRTSHVNQLASKTWQDGGYWSELIQALLRLYTNYGPSAPSPNSWYSDQYALQPRLYRLPPFPRSADLYILPEVGAGFFDFLDLGFSEGIYKFWESLPESTDAMIQSADYLGENLVNGFDTLGWYCPASNRTAKMNLQSHWLLKWGFTNA
jgi:hypothetical protein